MIIRRIPTPGLVHKSLTFCFGKRIVPVIQITECVWDNLRLGHNISRRPEILEHVSLVLVFTCDAMNDLLIFSSPQNALAYQMRFVSEYQRAFEESQKPERKETPLPNVPVKPPGMLLPAHYHRT